MAKPACTVEMTVDGNDIVARFRNGVTAANEAPRLNEKTGKPNKKGMVGHTGGFTAIGGTDLFLSAMLMRKVG